jgi:leukotriene A-4 hydrolase/aminopeptidase
MKFKSILFPAISASLLLFSCNNSQTTTETVKEENTLTPIAEDPHSYSEPNKARVTHLNWDAVIDFDNKVIEGTANWDIQTSPDADKIVFDVYGLDVKKVNVDGVDTEFSVDGFDEELGSSLSIAITPEAKQVSIIYKTGDKAKALQWLDPSQTAGKEMPFLFTQSQAILARTWIPCQDGPGVRYTYNANVKVPQGMLALMSADNPQEKNESGKYSFKMEQPIPSYLMALSAGDIVFKSLSGRTGVYAEPSILDGAVYEFDDLENMVKAAEGLYGSYAWDRYDIIVLPPSFPFGGMENPRLTFATPTILAGDRSLVSLVAHELAHSWSGNLVTNSTWDDFWLNEGFTVYFEHRIMEEVYGREYSEMLASLSRDGLLIEAAEMQKEVPNDTKLKLDLAGRNPDDGLTSIPYDKGYFFLRNIEETVGREKFDVFLKTYFDTFQFKVMDTEKFLEYLNSNLISEEQAKSLKINDWVYGVGIPDNIPVVKSNRFVIVDSILSIFNEKGSLPAKSVTDNWTTHEWLHFINHLPKDINTNALAKLDETYGFTQSNNSEISAAWFQPTIRNNYEVVYPKVESFLVNVGRRKFLTPTYKALVESGKKDMAVEIYAKARPNYHAVSRDTMDELLKS